MFRTALRTAGLAAAQQSRTSLLRPVVASINRQPAAAMSGTFFELQPDFDEKWRKYFMKPDIDDWELRQGINKIVNYDHIPDPTIVVEMLRAARRLDDLQVAIRIIEVVR